MFVSEGLLKKLSDVINRYQEITDNPCIPFHQNADIDQIRLKVQGQWFSAIASLETLLLSQIQETTEKGSTPQGLILSAPTPILCDPTLTTQLQTGIFTLQLSQNHTVKQFQLPAAYRSSDQTQVPGITEIPLFPQDPLATEQFCLVLTSRFSLLMVLGEDSLGLRAFQFSFDPTVIKQGWSLLRSRLKITHHPQLAYLDELVAKFAPTIPAYQIVSEFSRLLLHYLPHLPALATKKACSEKRDHQQHLSGNIPLNFHSSEETMDITLLQALTHEIRTPLTSIRTMTRLLLRSRELEPKMIKLLENIDQECSEQINRMELIFRATELKSQSNSHNAAVELVPTSLENLLNQCIPRWKKQAQRRDVDLDVGLPQKLPQVVSDPGMLDQVLTGLIEKCTRSLTSGGQIRVQVSTAGHQLKLQFQTQSHQDNNPFQALGNLLMFQPETGSLSLNLDVTKNLFHRLGGKLIVRQRSQQGEIFTIFLPLGSNTLKKPKIN